MVSERSERQWQIREVVLGFEVWMVLQRDGEHPGHCLLTYGGGGAPWLNSAAAMHGVPAFVPQPCASLSHEDYQLENRNIFEV
jgi:hypothetical protein